MGSISGISSSLETPYHIHNSEGGIIVITCIFQFTAVRLEFRSVNVVLASICSKGAVPKALHQLPQGLELDLGFRSPKHLHANILEGTSKNLALNYTPRATKSADVAIISLVAVYLRGLQRYGCGSGFTQRHRRRVEKLIMIPMITCP